MSDDRFAFPFYSEVIEKAGKYFNGISSDVGDGTIQSGRSVLEPVFASDASDKDKTLKTPRLTETDTPHPGLSLYLIPSYARRIMRDWLV